jgi:hypothetical protein
MNASLRRGVIILAATMLTLPALASQATEPHRAMAVANDVVVVGHYAFVAGGSSGLLVLDITDPATPTLEGSLDTSGQACGVTVAGNYAFVADGSDGLQVIDISDPASPFLVGNFDMEGSARAVTTFAGHALVAAGMSGLQVIEVRDPVAPSLTGKKAAATAPAKPMPRKVVR